MSDRLTRWTLVGATMVGAVAVTVLARRAKAAEVAAGPPASFGRVTRRSATARAS